MELLKEVFGRDNPKSILDLTLVPLSFIQQILQTVRYVLEKQSQLLNSKGSWCSQKQDMIRKDTYWFLGKTTGLNSQKVTMAAIRKVTNKPEIVCFGNGGDSSSGTSVII